MIILSADDPQIHSSQTNRITDITPALANIPMLEPSNPQEVKDLMKFGYQLSEEYQILILMRTTTRVSHMRGTVNVDSRRREKLLDFSIKTPKDLSRYLTLPG